MDTDIDTETDMDRGMDMDLDDFNISTACVGYFCVTTVALYGTFRVASH
jgi:hypothetical protein